MSYERDRKWSDAFMPEIKAILGMHIIGEAPYEEDAHRNTDLIVLKMEAIRIAVRMRTYKNFEKYPNDFTIRVSRGSGNETEMMKIMKGFGNLMFYGFEDQNGRHVGRWTIIDLDVFRGAVWDRQLRTKEVPGFLRTNPDGSSDFRVFRFAEFPPTLIRAQGDGFPQFSRPTAKAIELTHADIPF